MDVPLIVKDCKLVRFPIHTGIEPMKFPPSSKDSKSLKNSIFEGIVEPSPFNDIEVVLRVFTSKYSYR